ncbi:OmpA family protein [gut metagenome]|uniref:OmpA family protein n=1 Tax=gut metagenome TaxID=749906 RepID=J9FQ76_9ZZZZ
MKKTFTFLALSVMTLGAQAQKTVQGSGLWDNLSIGLVGGGVVPLTHSDYIKDVRGVYGLDVTKQITPIYGLGLQLTGAHNVTGSSCAYDVMNVSLLGKFNLMNAFGGYKGTPRLFEVEAVAAAGWGHSFYPSTEGSDKDFMTSKFGLNLNFNLGEQKAWTVSLMPAIAYNLSTPNHNSNPSYNINQSAFELMAGVTYHFKNKNNGRHYMTLQKAYDQAEVDGLNAKVNDLRAQVNDKEAEVAKLNNNVKALQQEVNELRNRGPVFRHKRLRRIRIHSNRR